MSICHDPAHTQRKRFGIVRSGGEGRGRGREGGRISSSLRLARPSTHGLLEADFNIDGFWGKRRRLSASSLLSVSPASSDKPRVKVLIWSCSDVGVLGPEMRLQASAARPAMPGTTFEVHSGAFGFSRFDFSYHMVLSFIATKDSGFLESMIRCDLINLCYVAEISTYTDEIFCCSTEMKTPQGMNGKSAKWCLIKCVRRSWESPLLRIFQNSYSCFLAVATFLF
ncbi:hypothetical protein MUK42_35813 [Musa troglodytarum]|uniref:Uncharacterized protein n=1 Tax=Musa troglodytarum TaxID=320322 RepID=A0A9E7KL65_9LILI|nr:hypothetical protein MUK42_35813 [Musa troglodytarum]